MKTRITKSIFFLILFSIFFLVPISSFSTNVVGAEDPVIISDFLKVDLIKFNDATPGDTITGPSYIPGGRDLHSFENKGILEGSYNSETNTFIVWAEATFGFEVNVWTANLIEDIYPNAVFDSEGATRFFRYRTWKHEQLWLPFIGTYCAFWDQIVYGNAIDETYYFRYKEVDYGDVYNVNDHEGSIETKIWIDPGRKLSGETTIAGQTFTTPILESDILDVSIVDIRGGEVGSYDDRYTGIVDGDDESAVKITTLDSWRYPVDTIKIVNWLDEKVLGWHTPEELTVANIQQGEADPSFKGDFPGSNENEMTFNLPIHLQPEVTKTQQYIPYTHSSIKYYPCCGKLVTYPVVDDKVERDLSVHVYNQFVHYDLEVKLDLFMNCEFDAELSESFLDDPNLIITDRIWDGTIFQEEPDILLPPPDTPWWMWVIIACIIGVVIYVVYIFYKRYAESKKKPVQVIVRR